MLWHFRLCVCVCVCLSVCLSVTCLLYIKTAKHFVKILLPPGSLTILVFSNGDAEYKGDEKIGQFFNNKLVYLGNGSKYSRSCYTSRIGNHTDLPNGATSDDLE